MTTRAKLKHKVPLKIRQLNTYIRNKLGCSGRPNVSLYDLVCEALEKDGRKIPEGMDQRQWIIQNIELIKEIVFGRKKYKPSINNYKPDINVMSDEFLRSFEWRRIRMEALKKYGSRCMCCGATPDKGVMMNVDHIKPRKFYPELALDLNNLQILCEVCNHGKGNWDMTDWRKSKKQINV